MVYMSMRIILAAASIVVAQNRESDLLNQLYHEIVSAAPHGTGADSMAPLSPNESPQNVGYVVPEHNSGDKTVEQLRQEIEAMVRDAHNGHNDAVRFMLEK